MRKLIPVVVLSIFFWGCTKENWTPERELITDRFVAVYYSAALFRSVSDEGRMVLFGFSDDSEVCADGGVIPVFAANDGNFPDVSEKNGKWRINGKTTSVPSTIGLGNLRSKLVCVAYDCNAIVLYMSNGNRLHIPSSAEGSLWNFSFHKEDNPMLPSDLYCAVSGTSIGFEMPYGVLSSNLCPDISYRGKSLKVKGLPQRNRNSKQDFSGTVEYELQLFDDTSLTYKVSLTEPYPTVRLYTDGKTVEKSDYVAGMIKITDPEGLYWGTEEFASGMKIRGRGNSTWTSFPKKPYKIKLDEKSGIFGAHKNRDWVLLANYADKSLMRNTLAMRMSKVCGMEWTPDIFNVDVYLNDEYMGSYDWTEHKEVAKHRVDIDVDNGDCYLEIEAKKDNPVWFDTSMNIPIMFSDPELPSESLKEEVMEWFSGFEQSLVSSYRDDPDRGYRAYVEVDSFINNYIIQELSKNIDGDLFKSLFLVKRKGGKLEFCHVWDFDLAFGNCNYLSAHAGVSTGPKGWYICNHTQEGIDTGWYYYMFKDPWFSARVKERWHEVYPALQSLPDEMRAINKRMYGSAGRNFSRWPILDQYVWPNLVWLGNYGEEVNYLLDFYTERLEWMNSQFSLESTF